MIIIQKGLIMKVALIFPNYNLGRILKISFHPPLGLAMLAAVTEKAGYDISVIDAAALNLTYERLIAKLKDFNPNVIGITTNIILASRSLELSRLIQRQLPNVKLVFGGPWASTVYEMLLRKKFCDYVIVGEGEYAFIELLKALEKDSLPEKYPGIAYLDPKTKTIQLTPACPIEDLDELPFPAWHLLPPSKKYFYNPLVSGKTFYPIMTSRGCPYQCNHCTKIIHGKIVRFRSVENVIKEIQYLKERFSLDELLIIDDNFTINPKRAEEICDAIIKNNFNIRISFSNGVRADTLTPKLVKKLKHAGTYFIAIGVESGNQYVLNKIGKHLDLNAVKRAVDIIKEEKVLLATFFMIGHPYDNLETMNDTINFALEINPDYLVISETIAFPGTELYNLIQREGKFLISPLDIDRGYFTGKANFEIYDLKAKDVEKMFKMAYRRLFLHPKRILTLVKKINTFSGLKYIINYSILILLRLLNLNL